MVSHHNMVSPQMVPSQNGDTRGGPTLPSDPQTSSHQGNAEHCERPLHILRSNLRFCGFDALYQFFCF